MTKTIKEASRKMRTSTKVAIGAGVALAGIAAAYFLTGERGKKNRKTMKEWAVKANAQLSALVKKAGNVTKTQYEKIVAEVASHYKDLSKTELAELTAMLRSHWNEFAKQE